MENTEASIVEMLCPLWQMSEGKAVSVIQVDLGPVECSLDLCSSFPMTLTFLPITFLACSHQWKLMGTFNDLTTETVSIV